MNRRLVSQCAFDTARELVGLSRGTANTLAKTFLGGLLVAIGVALTAFLGGKHKSA